MKKTRLFIFAVLATVTAVSCNKEIAETAPIPAEEKVYVTFSATGEDITKVTLDFDSETNIASWQDTDDIAVFDGVSKHVFTVKSGTNTGATAVFEGEVNDAAGTLYAVYPASGGFDIDGTNINVTVPAEQTIPTDGCVDPKALVAVASGTKGGSLAFKQVCGLLKVSFNAKNVREITISGASLAGEAKVAPDGTLVEPLKPVDEIVLTHADGIFPAGIYYVPLLPGTTPAGNFSITVKKGPSIGFKGASNPVTFTRCKGVDSGSLDNLPTKTEIKTMAELFDWNANRAVGDSEEFVIIGADIDMENEPWVPKDFKGEFDGQDHKLYNLNVSRSSNACFFNTLTGTMKNITIGSSDGSTYDGVSKIEQNNTEDTSESGWRYAGLVTRLAEGSSLEYVTSFVPVSVAATSTSKTRVGGLVAIVAGAASISDCANLGDVTNNATSPVAAGAIAGIVGWADAAVTMNFVQNKGNVTSKNIMTQYVAGILSYDKTAGSNLTDCSNSGNVTAEAEGSCAMCMGGIIGESGNSVLTSCINEGALSSTCDGELKAGGIIGRSNSNCTLTGCINGETGTITFNPATFGSNAFIGGIVGNAPAANTGTAKIMQCKNYAPLSATHRNVVTVGGIAGFLNMGEGTIEIDGCVNTGAISRIVDDSGAAKNNNLCLGGIVASMNSASGSILNCSNTGAVSTNTNQGSATIRIGGIAGWLQAYTTVKNCTNSGAVEYRMGDIKVAGSTIHIGGVVGHLVKGSSVISCNNSGNVFADRKQVNRMGGIVGTCNSSAVASCENTGNVTVEVPESTALALWQAVGGIIGFAEGTTAGCTRALENCKNRGAISATINTVPQYEGRFAVGGIVGMPYTGMPVTGNKNYGAVEGKNTNAVPWCYVGGIFGTDFGASSGCEDISGNSNYGAISCLSTVGANSAAGNLYGRIAKAASASGSCFGTVSALTAGAVAGVNTTSLTATICDAVTVNGIAKSAAESEAGWLCPSNTGTITPTYVAHSAGE